MSKFFQRLTKSHEPMGQVQIGVYYLFQIVRGKSCDNVLIIYMKKYEIAYYNYAEAKCTHQVQKLFIQTLQVTLCVWSKQ